MLGEVEPDSKRKRSDEGLLGLLGTYASDEDDLEAPDALRRLSSREDQVGPLRPSEEADAPVLDLTSEVQAGLESQSLAESAPAAAEGAPSASEGEPGDAAMEDAPERFWLPSELSQPPAEPCPPDIQAKVAEYIRKQEATGTTIGNTLRSLSGYRNPDFLQHCVMYDNISEYGTCYPADVFDPNNLPPEDYYDRLAVEWQQHAEKLRLERSKAQKIDFLKAGALDAGRPPVGGIGAGGASSAAAKLVAQAKAASAGQRASKWDTKR